MLLTGEIEELGEKPVPVPLCPTRIPLGLNLAQTRVYVVTALSYDTASSHGVTIHNTNTKK
jgi:hypothetical protein